MRVCPLGAGRAAARRRDRAAAADHRARLAQGRRASSRRPLALSSRPRDGARRTCRSPLGARDLDAGVSSPACRPTRSSSVSSTPRSSPAPTSSARPASSRATVSWGPSGSRSAFSLSIPARRSPSRSTAGSSIAPIPPTTPRTSGARVAPPSSSRVVLARRHDGRPQSYGGRRRAGSRLRPPSSGSCWSTSTPKVATTMGLPLRPELTLRRPRSA